MTFWRHRRCKYELIRERARGLIISTGLSITRGRDRDREREMSKSRGEKSASQHVTRTTLRLPCLVLPQPSSDSPLETAHSRRDTTPAATYRWPRYNGFADNKSLDKLITEPRLARSLFQAPLSLVTFSTFSPPSLDSIDRPFSLFTSLPLLYARQPFRTGRY